MKHTWWESGKL